MVLSSPVERDGPDILADVEFGVQVGCCCRSAGGNQSCRWSCDNEVSGVSVEKYVAR